MFIINYGKIVGVLLSLVVYDELSERVLFVEDVVVLWEVMV